MFSVAKNKVYRGSTLVGAMLMQEDRTWTARIESTGDVANGFKTRSYAAEFIKERAGRLTD